MADFLPLLFSSGFRRNPKLLYMGMVILAWKDGWMDGLFRPALAPIGLCLYYLIKMYMLIP
ncbi:hypothetical protein M433DRAFT_160287 [Acidomyces richmondensis BFW]|nr:hypothetical protein M433DRAFT_160287 [Acidomyces richmondensis BFW]